MEQLILPYLMGGFVGILAWLGRRFVAQMDKLAESVARLATVVATIQTEQKAIWKRIDLMERG